MSYYISHSVSSPSVGIFTSYFLRFVPSVINLFLGCHTLPPFNIDRLIGMYVEHIEGNSRDGGLFPCFY